MLEAGEAGLPVAATRLIAGQFGWGDRKIAASDNPAALAALCVGLHEDAALWNGMRAPAGGGGWPSVERSGSGMACGRCCPGRERQRARAPRICCSTVATAAAPGWLGDKPMDARTWPNCMAVRSAGAPDWACWTRSRSWRA